MLHLPLELLFCITRQLPPESVACLALCNQFLHSILANDHLPPLQISHGARFRFLTALVRDQPEYYVCHRCIKLHLRSSVLERGTHPDEQPLACVRKDAGLRLHENSVYEFQYVHIQLTMERYRQGPQFGFSLDSFAHTEVEANKEHGTITLISTEARIASNKFLLRTQTWILSAPKPPGVTNGKAYALHFCDKIGTKQCNGLFLYNIMNDRFRTSKKFFFAKSWQTWDWSMDYRIEVVDFGGRGHAIVTTRWIDLSSGMKPSDWKRMMDLAQQKPSGDMYYSMTGWSRKKFEALDGPSLDQITTKNAMTLIAFPKELVSRLDRRPRCTSDAIDALEARGYDGRYWKCRDGDIDWWYPAPSRNEIFPTPPGELVNRHGMSVL